MKKSLISLCLTLVLLLVTSLTGNMVKAEENDTIETVTTYRLSSSYTEEQGPVWFYKYYDKVAQTYHDLTYVTPVTNTIHWVGDQALDAWMLPSSTGKDGYIFAGQTWLPADGYNLSAQFVVPETGKLDIDFIASRDFPSDWDPAKEIYLRVIKNNGENLLCEDDWVTLKPGLYDDIKYTCDLNEIEVTQGDVIAVELDYGDVASGWPRTYLDPVMTLKAEKTMPNSFRLSELYTAEQGPIFFYKYFDKAAEEYHDLQYVTPYTNTIHWVGDQTLDAWMLPAELGDAYIFAGQTWLPAAGYNLSLQFVAPKDGYINLDFIASRDFPNDWDGAKEIYLRVIKNNGDNLLSDDAWVTLRPGLYDDIKYTCDLNNIEVVKGDVIAIELDYGEGQTGWPRTYLDPVFTYVKEIDLLKAEVKAELDSWVNEHLAEYRAAQQEQINTLVSEAKIAIDAAATQPEVDEIMATLEAARANIKTDAQLTKDEHVQSVVDLIDAIDTVEYTPECLAKIEAAEAAYATLTDEEKAMLAEEKANLLTAAAKQYVDLELAHHKEAAKAQIDEIVTPTYLEGYRENEKNTINTLVSQAKTAIDTALTKEAIAPIVSSLQQTLGTIVTDAELTAQELEEAKTNAKSELEAYKNPSDYRDEEKAQLATIVTDGKAAIDAATDVAGVDDALKSAKAEADALKTKAQYDAETPEQPENPEQPETPVNPFAGCTGSFVGSIFAMVALTGMALFVGRKKENN